MKPERLTSIVDVGAAAIDTPPPYATMLAQGMCSLVGFEPQENLWPQHQYPNCRYAADVIGNGSCRTLHICNAPGMTGLFAPDRVRQRAFSAQSHDGIELGGVVKMVPVTTRRLDDIAEIATIDYLKIDAQGAEWMIIDGARQKLADAVCVQTEVSFVPLYVDQPMFRDVDAILSELGFMFHTFAEMQVRMIAPHRAGGAMNQVVQADAVYFRDFTRLDALSNEQLKHTAMIAKNCYRSDDLVYRCTEAMRCRGGFSQEGEEWWQERSY